MHVCMGSCICGCMCLPVLYARVHARHVCPCIYLSVYVCMRGHKTHGINGHGLLNIRWTMQIKHWTPGSWSMHIKHKWTKIQRLWMLISHKSYLIMNTVLCVTSWCSRILQNIWLLDFRHVKYHGSNWTWSFN